MKRFVIRCLEACWTWRRRRWIRSRPISPRYASILRELKKRVNPDELGATVQGIREKRSKDLLVELKCSTKSRGRLDTAFKEAVGASGTIRHLIPRIKVAIADLKPTIEAEDAEVSVRRYFDQGPGLELSVSLSKTPYRSPAESAVKRMWTGASAALVSAT